ncbi:YqjF family protein [Sediminibacillus massiliensis]|uniref:YqjF family protein n=1 Tax=Sediminibacillus massiliensis TaxID=1926277 RepID=UPI0009889064|nr:DUF2071 domain-containing protein [Sediminibacillus massiliensis]
MRTETKWKPWVATQKWNDLLFIHWPVPYESIRTQVPDEFEVETYDGQAWLSIVPFYGTSNRFRGMPGPIPFSSFLELNVRTYVNYKGDSGVYFFSLDASSDIAVAGARKLFSLPYFKAKMRKERNKHGILFTSRRTEKGAHPASFSAHYKPISQKSTAREGSLTHWLVERYCLWTIKGDKVLKGPIKHEPWDVQEAILDLDMDGMADFVPDSFLEAEPIVQFCQEKKVRFFPFEEVGRTEKTSI